FYDVTGGTSAAAVYSDTWGDDWQILHNYFEGIVGRVIYERNLSGNVGTNWRISSNLVNTTNTASYPAVKLDGNRNVVSNNTFRSTSGANPVVWIANIQNEILGNLFIANGQTAADILLEETSNTVSNNTFAHKSTSAGSFVLGTSKDNQVITGNQFY